VSYDPLRGRDYISIILPKRRTLVASVGEGLPVVRIRVS